MPDITLPSGLKAHLAVSPVGEGPWPGVVVLLRVAGSGYHGPSAEDAWRRILRFFEAQLRA